MKKINIGLAQLEPFLGDIESNTNNALKMIDEAVRSGAQIICFPELFSTGYNQKFIKENSIELGKKSIDFTINKIKNKCKELDVSVVAPIAEYYEKYNYLYNSVYVIDRNGEICHIYRKIHLWDEEKYNFKEGNNIDTFKINGVDYGAMICYDSGFPEIARILALKGSKVIFIPTAWVDSGEWAFNIAMAARALENGVFIVAVNRVGEEEGSVFFGGSKIYNPKGEIIFESPKFKESIDVFQINLDEVRLARKDTPYLRDRRPEIYNKIEIQ